MQKQQILKAINSEKYEGSHARLADSKNKRNTYNKISIYSNKYTNLSSTSLTQDDRSARNAHVTSIQLISSKPQIFSNKKDEFIQDTKSEASYHHQIPSKPPTIIKIQQKSDKHNQHQQLSRLVMQQMQIMQEKYGQKMSFLIQQNNRNIQVLKGMLINQQKQMQQKEQIISKLVNTQNNGNNSSNNKHGHPSSPKIKISFGVDKQNRVNQKLSPNTQQYYLQRIKDLQATLKVLMDAFITSQQQLNHKIQRLEHNLIKYQTSRINKCWTRVDKFCQLAQHNFRQIDNKIRNQLDPSLFKMNNQAISQTLSIFHQKLNLISKEIQNLKEIKVLSSKQREILALKSLINDLLFKTSQLQMKQTKSSRKIVQQYLQDDDQFFYPPTQRKSYHQNNNHNYNYSHNNINLNINDQYEHFPSSQDESSNHNNLKQNFYINSNESLKIYASLDKLKNH